VTFQRNSVELACCWELIGLALGKVAHDWSNILTGINGFTELAILQVAGQSAVEGFLQEVHQSGMRGVRLANRLRLLKHCASGRPTFHASVEPVLASVISEVVSAFSPPPRIHQSFASDLGPVRLDHDALRTVLTEILVNALEAVGKDGEVCIAVNRVVLDTATASQLVGRAGSGPHVRITIEDDGPGISEANLEKILTVPLFTTKSGGRGFGLPIVFRTLYAHQGAFWIRSREPRGTIVEVWLPMGGLAS
jgi:signal transduction histidine kinase